MGSFSHTLPDRQTSCARNLSNGDEQTPIRFAESNRINFFCVKNPAKTTIHFSNDRFGTPVAITIIVAKRHTKESPCGVVGSELVVRIGRK